MTKPAMPKMPEPVAFRFLSRVEAGFAWSAWLPISELHHYDCQCNVSPGPGPSWVKVEYLHDGRACYLAGLEAARGAVPARCPAFGSAEVGHNACRAATLAALDQLTKDASHE